MDQNFGQKSSRRFKRSALGWLLLLIFIATSVVSLGLVAHSAQAQILGQTPLVPTNPPTYQGKLSNVPPKCNPAFEVCVGDTFEHVLTAEGIRQDINVFWNEWIQRVTFRQVDKTAARIFKTGLHYIFNTLAYDLATWIASGGKGQQPLFITEGWGPYLLDIADGASGHFLEGLGLVDWIDGFNICEPNFQFKLNIGLGIGQTRRPEKPACTIKTAIQNWEEFLNDENFLNRFSFEFSPQQNDILVAFQVFDRYYEWQASQQAAATKEREEGDSYKAVTEKISGKVKTPSKTTLTFSEALATQGLSLSPEAAFTGDIIADALGTFVGTLANKLLQRVLTEGIASFSGSDRPTDRSGNISRAFFEADPDLFNPDGSRAFLQGREAAQARFSTFLDAGIVTGGPFEILQNLATCVDIDNPSPDECVIDDEFRLAIEQELTVREALAAGFLDGNAPFGYVSKETQPKYNEGYPYRSLIILRTHRIIPVTWEIAASIINQGFDRAVQGQVGAQQRTYTLNQLIAAYNDPTSPFHRLLDPNWVLKATEAFCNAEGYGPILNNEQVIGVNRSVSRAFYCADYQSCLEKDAGGNCIFGYCTEERRIWNLGGELCPAQFATCQAFQSRDGEVNAYLQSTLDYNGCDSGNVGCQWYCQDYNTVNGLWTCVNEGERTLTACSQPGGCQLTAACDVAVGGQSCSDEVNGINLLLSSECNPGSKFWNGSLCAANATCNITQGGVACTQTGCEAFVNFLANPSFEAGQFDQLAQNWTGDTTYFERVGGSAEQVFAGSNSIRFFRAGGQLDQSFQSDSLTLSAGTYSFSTHVFNRLNQGDIKVSIIDATTGLPLTGGDGNPIAKSFNTSFANPNLAKNRWQELSTNDFTVNGSQSIKVRIQVYNDTTAGELQVNGTAWFDGFRISESCVVNPVTLALAGTSEVDNSKIHFDRDLQACDQNADGCSRFLVAPAAISYTAEAQSIQFTPGNTIETAFTANSYNLVPNPGFESGLDPWTINIDPGVQITAEPERADVHSGTTALKLIKGSTPASAAALGINIGQALRGRTFIFSLWAKTSDNNPGPLNTPTDGQHFDENLIAAISSPADAYRTSINMARSITDNQGLSSQWKRFAVPIHFDNQYPTTGETTLALNLRPLEDTSKFILYDDIQIQEIDFARANPLLLRSITQDECIGTGRASRPYTIWIDNTCYNLDLPSLLNRPAVTIRQAPDYLDCRGYTIERSSPFVLQGVSQEQCDAGTNLYWDPTSCVGGSCCHEIDPPECFNYAPYCFADEVGCQAYQPTDGDPTVPGVVRFDDFCPAACVGYQAYKQSPTAFETQETLEFFIPSTAKQCNATEAGCDEFTNLDEVAQGGEGRDYFSYLRQCALPTDQTANCSNFYTWQGSDESGFQLMVHQLSAIGNDPKLAISDPNRQPEFWGECSGPDDVRANPFCREVFDSTGGVHYIILDNTVTCSDNCHPFRKTRLGEDNITAQLNCTESNGTWDPAVAACIYMAIPEEGIQCSAAAAGCREYRGNAGGNVFTAFADNFEDGDIRGWREGQISNVALSVGGHSIKTSQNFNVTTSYSRLLGGSCSPTTRACADANDVDCYEVALNRCRAQDALVGDRCLVDVGSEYCSVIGNRLTAGRTYLISFWAKSSTNGTIPGVTVQMVQDNPSSASLIATSTIAADWQYYTLGPFVANQVNSSSRFTIQAQAGGLQHFYVDNVNIREIRDHVYGVKNSWQTPAICDQNPYVDPIAPAPQFMLGCQAYRTPQNDTVNLKSFNHLCREEVVGCQALVDTQNSSSPYRQTFNEGDDIGFIEVPADGIVYLVDQPQFRCSAENLSCQRIGLPTINQNNQVVGYSDAYVLNNPDAYSTILCGSDEVGCEEFRSQNSFEYFKTPGDRLCEYRQIPGGTNFGWFKVGSTALLPDCPVTQSPLGQTHPDPGQDWVGLCPNQFSGCTEFVDPVSEISVNSLFNSNFQQDVDGNAVPDGWNLTVSTSDRLEQTLRLKPSTVYTVAIDATADLMDSIFDNDFSVQIDCPNVTSFDNSLRGVCLQSTGQVVSRQDRSCSSDINCELGERCGLQLPPNDYLGDLDRRDSLPSDQRQYSGRFFVPDSYTPSQQCRLVVELDGSGSAGLRGRAQQLLKQIAVSETGVYYELSDTVDRRNCNGVVDPDNECVLFNNRGNVNFKIGPTDTTYLVTDADVSGLSINGGLPVVQCAGTCDADTLLKVRPDRTCGEWLECRTEIKAFDERGAERDFCIELAACDSFDESGNCDNFVLPNLQQINSYAVDLDNDSATAAEPLRNLVTDSGSRDRLANLSGYVQAGTTLAGLGAITGQPFESQNTVAGYYPYNLMSQVGAVAAVPNGDFEEVGPNQYPIGWEPADSNGPRESFRFKIIGSGAEAVRTEGIRVLGTGSLKLTADNVLISDLITVFPNTAYSLSVDLNTQNLQPEQASAVVDVVDTAGNSLLGSQGNPSAIGRFARSLPEWRSQAIIFNTLGNDFIRIRLANSSANPAELAGATYFDNISLLPALQVSNRLQSPTPQNQLVGSQWLAQYISRSCRAYPQESSLSCRYIDANGIEQRGWSGYCLVSDPNNSQVCLQWWPIDLIEGDLFGQFPGYQDRVPQYYCAQVSPTTFRVLAADSGVQSGPPSQGGGTSVRTLVPESDYGEPNFIEIIAVPAGGDSNFTVENLRLNADINWEAGWIGEFADANNHDYSDYNVVCDPNLIINGLDNVCTNGFCSNSGFPCDGVAITDGWARACLAAATCVAEDESGHCLHYIGGTALIDSDGDGVTEPWPCQDTRIYGSTLDGVPYANPPTCGNDNIEQDSNPFLACSNTILPDRLIEQVINGGLGPNNAIMNGADRAKAAVGNTNDYCLDALPNGEGYDKGLDNFKATFLYFKAHFTEEGAFSSLDYGLCDLSSKPGKFQIFVYFHYAYCSEIVQVVTPTGQNKAWLSRISEGSRYLVDSLGYRYSRDFQPFGSLVYPEPAYDPTQWDAKNDSDDNPNTSLDDVLYLGNQPLFIEAPDTQRFEPPYQVRAGSPYSCVPSDDPTDISRVECRLPDRTAITLQTEEQAAARLKRLFAQSYGVWRWFDATDVGTSGQLVQYKCGADTPHSGSECNVDRDCYLSGQSNIRAGACEAIVSRYIKVDPQTDAAAATLTWRPPDRLCLNNQRPSTFNQLICDVLGVNCDYCGVAPLVRNITINEKNRGEVRVASVTGSGSIDLSYNAVIDPDQLPLSSYRLDWGDDIDSVSGVSLRDRSDTSSPYQFSHGYSYYDLLQKNQTADRIYCSGETIPNLCDTQDVYCTVSADCAPFGESCGRIVPSNTCAVQPRIQLIDNWGWCNGDINVNTNTPRAQWGYSTTPPSGQVGCFDTDNAWTYYPGVVIIGLSQ